MLAPIDQLVFLAVAWNFEERVDDLAPRGCYYWFVCKIGQHINGAAPRESS
jgi:hypothetical protein